jgi:hypothetical protein
MWKAFFLRAQIVGLDIQDKSFVDQDRIRTYQGSQTDPAILQQIVDDAGEIKVVIDDGSHRPEHIRETFAYLFPMLAPDGIYAIEDTQTSCWRTWGGSEILTAPETTISMIKDFVDGLHWEEFLDGAYRPTYVDKNLKAIHAYHNLVIMEKGLNVEGSTRGRTRKTKPRRPPPAVHPVALQRQPFSVPAVVSGGKRRDE